MPRHVDDEARALEIARAVVRLVATQGLRAATFRSVAAALGTSTTVITRLLPDREALLDAAFDTLRADFRARASAALSAPDRRSRVRGLIDAALPIEGDVASWLAYGHFMMEGVPRWSVAYHEDQGWWEGLFRAELEEAQREGARLPVPVPVAVDLCTTVADGVTAALVTCAEDWPEARQFGAVEGILDALGLVAGK